MDFASGKLSGQTQYHHHPHTTGPGHSHSHTDLILDDPKEEEDYEYIRG